MSGSRPAIHVPVRPALVPGRDHHRPKPGLPSSSTAATPVPDRDSSPRSNPTPELTRSRPVKASPGIQPHLRARRGQDPASRIENPTPVPFRSAPAPDRAHTGPWSGPHSKINNLSVLASAKSDHQSEISSSSSHEAPPSPRVARISHGS